MGSSRQSQTQATIPLHSPAPATDPFFTIPDGADQPLIQAILLSRCVFIEQQAAILAAAHMHWGPRDIEAKSAANSALTSADSPTAVRNLAGPAGFSGAAAHGPELAAHSSGPTSMSTSQMLAEISATPVPPAADVEAQQTAVTEVLQETGTLSS